MALGVRENWVERVNGQGKDVHVENKEQYTREHIHEFGDTAGK